MDNSVSFSILDNKTDEVLKITEARIETALKACGTQAVSHAVVNITSQGAVDTGLLRNSITYALDGEPAKKTSYHAAKGSNKNSKGKRYSASSVKAGVVKLGRYSGTAPKQEDNKRTVYIGTNVEYAPYVELGTYKMKARPFLKPAMENNVSEYKAIIEKVLSK